MNEVAKQIGQRIIELRKAAGMTQLQLAEKCGMAQPNIARIENGTYATSIDVLSRIAEALGKKIELV
jgi:transcriptional regulator with XRE-family HTH domain